MAHIDKMPILVATDPACSGAAFTLSGASPVSATEKPSGAWEVEVREGSRVVVARGGSALTYEQACDQALGAANCGLDLLSIKGAADLGIVEAVDSHLAWWRAHDGTVLRQKSVATLTAAVSASAVVTDAKGNVAQPPAQPPLSWDESFTHFRRAQLTDDLFDAFGSVYLALESLLSQIAPLKPPESERAWLNRALSHVHAQVVKLDPLAPSGTSDPAAAVGGQVRDARNAVFHAKGNQARFMPHDWADRTKVSEALAGMVRLYLRIAKTHLQLRRSSSGLFAGGFRLLTNHLDSALAIHVTDDTTPFDPGQSSINPGGGNVAPLTTRAAPELDQPFIRYFIGRAPVTSLSGVRTVTRAVATIDDTPAVASVLDGQLTLSGFDWFEALMGIRVRNRGQPRDLYPV